MTTAREVWYVSYTVVMPPVIEELQAGPYVSQAVADEHERDIRGYTGVQVCFVTTQRYPDRRLISSGAPGELADEAGA